MKKIELEQQNEELKKEIGDLKNKIDNLESDVSDSIIRTEFAKAFGWGKAHDQKISPYSYTDRSEYKTPSWEQIFVEIGKLLSQETTLKTTKKLDLIEQEIIRMIKEDRNEN